MRHRLSLILTTSLVIVMSAARMGVALSPGGTTQPSIPSSQDTTAGADFIGSAVEPQPLRRAPLFDPQVSTMHDDSGNTKAVGYPGHLGSGTEVTTAAVKLGMMLWLPDGRLTSGYTDTSSGTPVYRIAAVDPETLEVESSWAAPVGQTLNTTYMYQKANGEILVGSKQGHIYVLQRHDETGKPVITVKRDIDLASQGVLGQGEKLLNSAFDGQGNIWFTTGGIAGIGDDLGTTSTVGYVDSRGKVHALHLDGQVVENGIAVHGTTAYVVTGPAGQDDHGEVTGAGGDELRQDGDVEGAHLRVEEVGERSLPPTAGERVRAGEQFGCVGVRTWPPAEGVAEHAGAHTPQARLRRPTADVRSRYRLREPQQGHWQRQSEPRPGCSACLIGYTTWRDTVPA
ncbi:hypothetical protein [Streptomyces himalayensis]|uniref:Uncharacterized protein n=1 Tax=Streptomyces himalayensis subsp. himalayensis TaxID=2756131 RepID=A0A7W0IE06_9ACTN|nr:hypothetical protein [Streptomyces himalayensis]MBA2951799.1 hypothetical protein [Streptomyces himalayensis subsp. himalayensis]